MGAFLLALTGAFLLAPPHLKLNSNNEDNSIRMGLVKTKMDLIG
jgi:hypothetical protein